MTKRVVTNEVAVAYSLDPSSLLSVVASLR